MTAAVSTGKIRGFVVDTAGAPVAGVAVFAVAELDEGRQVPLGVLASDAAGYLSFDLGEAAHAGTPKLVRLNPVGSELSAVTVPCNGSAGTSQAPFLLRLPSETRPLPRAGRKSAGDCGCEDQAVLPGGIVRRFDLPAVQNADTVDWQLSPTSFAADQPPTPEGADGCQTLLPVEVHKFPVATYRFTQVVRRSMAAAGKTRQSYGARSEGLPELGGLDVGDLQSLLTPPLAAAPRTVLPPPPPGGYDAEAGAAIGIDAGRALELGQVLSFSQKWLPLGNSLGKIAYSLPLAPCESVNIAVIDWSRSDRAVRQDQALSSENLVHGQRRDRSIYESVDAALSESQGGWSFQTGVGTASRGSASATIPIEAVDLNLSGGHGTTSGWGFGTAQSWGNRDLTSSSLQDLHDSIVQSTTVIRELNSTVVVQASQQESNYVETRTVTNHNHCHAMTVQYHEVLQRLNINTTYEGRRWALLIPYKLLAFDWHTALRHRTKLEQILLDRSLTPCFDATERLRLCPAVYGTDGVGGVGKPAGPGEHAATPVTPKITRYELRLKSGDSPTYGQVRVHLLVKDEWKQLFLKRRVREGGPEIGKQRWLTYSITSGEAIGAERKDISKVKVGWFENDGDDDWWLDGIEIRYVTATDQKLTRLMSQEGDPHLVYFNDAKEWVQAEGSWESETIPPAAGDTGKPDPSQTDKPQPPAYTKAGDEYAEQRLLAHLRANTGYYSRACWLLQDPTERVMMLDAHFATQPAVRTGIDPVPVAVVGNFVAFVFNGAEAPDPDPLPAPHSEPVSLPTRGLFAETRLSNCNSCEKRDVTRFWKWDEAPCGDKAPDITGITAGPRGQAPSLPQTTLPGPVVQVMNTPTEPDPTGLAAALKVLGTPDIFRDMSTKAEVSKLLDGLISGAVSLAQAKEMAAAAKRANEKPADAKPADKGRSAPNEKDSSQQIDKLNAIQYASDEGLITDQQRQNAAVAVLGGEPLDGGGSGTGGSGTAGTDGGTSGTVAGSSKAAALPLIAAFRAGTDKSPWKLDRTTVADGLEDLVLHPDHVSQAQLNLCGPAAFFRIWAARDPVAFAQFGIALFEKGESRIGSLKIQPDDDSLLGMEYAALVTKHSTKIPPQADWMLLGSLRDSENAFLDYEGRPEEDASGITLPGKLISWLQAAGTHSSIRDDTNLFKVKGLAHARTLVPGPDKDIVLLVNARLIGTTPAFLEQLTPNHYIGLEPPAVSVAQGKATFRYWTWGLPVKQRAIPTADFERDYYGAVIAQV